jgi:hypothetical protein
VSIKTVVAARELLRERGAMKLVPDLTSAIAGEPVRGTWWAHPRGKDIYRIANALEDDDTVLVAKLAEGKVTFVDERLFAAVARVVTDRGWRAARIAGLDAAAKRLLARVDREERVRIENRALAGARKALEAAALVRGVQEHTESGHHASVLESWRAWAPKAKRKLTLAAALAELRDVGIDLSEQR